MAPPLILQLALKVRDLQSSGPSDDLIDRTKLCLMDYIGAAIVGAVSKSARGAAASILSWGSGPSTMVGLPNRCPPPMAALYNGIAGHAEELDDSHSGVSGLHLAATVIPAALALAEAKNISGSEFMLAVACGYEAAGRLCRCMDKAHRKRGFHSTGTAGVFGSAAACAILLGQNEQGIANSMGMAASSAGGVFAFLEDGATVKHFHAGRAAMDGLIAATLANGGMTAPAQVLEADEGFFHAYADECDPSWLVRDLERPEIFATYHKIHSACGHTFPAIDAALRLRHELNKRNVASTAVKHIVYEGYHNSAILNKVDPGSIQQCRFSIPCVIALAIKCGQVSRQNIGEFISSQELQALAQKVTVRENEELSNFFPTHRAGILTAYIDGWNPFSIRIDSPLGTPKNPIGREDLRRKFFCETERLILPETASRILEIIYNLEHLSVRELMGALPRLTSP